MNKKPIISIVVAAYGVVEYLSEAIESVISNENWDEYSELIIVNDGSTDGTTLLLNEYNKKINSRRFIVINQDNMGLSAARNSGLSAATGEYISFLDGDDFINNNGLKCIKACLEENKPDCLIVDFNYYWDDGGIQETHKYKGLKQRKLLNVVNDNVLSSVYHNMQVYAWRHIFKRSILEKRLSPVGYNYEDIRTVPLHINECETVYYLPIKYIQYRQRSGSIMSIKNVKNILDLSSSLRGVTDELKQMYSKLPQDIALEHSIFNLYIFTWSCGDTLSNKELKPKELYPKFVDNFEYSNLVNLSTLKKVMKRDPKNWRKFIAFYKYPKLFYLAFYLRHNFNKMYKIMNNIRELVYKT